MTDLPAPLTPPNCDLRGFDNLQLDVDLLPKSKLANYAEAEAFRAAVLLWCEAWKQVPAASLPDDDLELRSIAGLQRDPATWERIKKDALSKFVKCSDGRLYHEVLAEKACEAWGRRIAFRERAKAGGKASAAARGRTTSQPDGQPQVQPAAQPQVKEVEGEGEVDSGLPNGKPSEARKRASRIAADFQIPEDWIGYGLQGGLTKAEIDLLFEELKTWSLTKKQGTSLDWLRTWQTWCRRHASWGCARTPQGSPVVSVPDHPDPECAEKWNALRSALGDKAVAAWFTTEGRSDLRKNCSGFIIEAKGVKADRIKQQFAPRLTDIFGKGQWRVEAPP